MLLGGAGLVCALAAGGGPGLTASAGFVTVTVGAGGGPLTVGLAVEEKIAGGTVAPATVLEAEGACRVAVAVAEVAGAPVVTFDFSAAVEALTAAVGFPGVGEEGLTTTPVPPLVGATKGPAEGTLLVGVVVPVLSMSPEVAGFSPALSFCCPEKGAVTVTTLLFGVVVAGVVVPPTSGIFSVVPVGKAATLPFPRLAAVSVDSEAKPFVPFKVEEETAAEGLLPLPVEPIFAPLAAEEAGVAVTIALLCSDLGGTPPCAV